MLQLIDSNESVLTPTLTYQEDVFSKEAWDAEDSTLRRIVQPLLDDGTILIDDDSMIEKDGALRAFVYAVTNHPDRILQEDIIIGANIIQRREAIERWKSEEGLSIMKLSMDYDILQNKEEGVDTIDWDEISLGKRYEVPNELLDKIEQYVIPSIFKEESSTRNTSSAWTTIDATIVKYNEGDLQVPHIDPCDATLLICLQPSIEGGSTCFPLLNPPLRLENRRGGDGYLFFSSKVLGGARWQDDDDDNNDDCSRGRDRNALSLHHGGRVTKGNKIVIQLMLKYSGFGDLQTWLEVLA